MLSFLGEHVVEVIFGLISAGALAFCKYLHSQLKSYRRLLKDETDKELDTKIEDKLQPVLEEIEELRRWIREADSSEKHHIELIVASYRYRLIQLCRIYLKQGYMNQEQYDQLSEFYKVYHELGGNGQAKEYYETTMKLEIRPND